ncbi:hypothetical protein V565_053490 [Rhizoctonia solani 123E]|uniref:Uncharacterized protein n=1 Tax=Rhizoctonia solani 123E TaxID=1423351 RepID=A0A074S2Z1_9AGAM|nr:hypothetical protein V565_053490 [Rhizoctonia solani 123E]
MRFSFSSLAILAAAVGSVAANAAEYPSINPPLSSVRHVDFASLPPAAEPATNAKRFSQGLPPMRPRSRKHNRNIYHDIEEGSLKRATRAASAPRAEISPIPPVQRSCNILAKAADTTLGYLAPRLNIFGQYGVFQAGQAGALEVSISYVPGSDASVDLVPTNGPTKAYPYMGAAVGYASESGNLGPGTQSHAYVAATRQTPPRSPPVSGDNSVSVATGIPADYESAIWVYDPLTSKIRAQWVNTDGSTPVTHLLYSNDGSDALILTGDPDTLNSAFGSNYPEITLTCVPPAAQPV